MTLRLKEYKSLRCLTIVMAIFVVAFGAMQNACSQIPSQAEFEAALAMELPEDPATIVAVVGNSKILLGDLKSKVDARISGVLEKSEQEIPADQIKFARVNLTRGLLKQAIDTKRMRESFLLLQVGTQAADKRQEASEMMASRARQMFVDSEVPELLKRYEVGDMTQLDEKLRSEGTSLQARQRDFCDAMLAHMYVRESIDKDPKVSLAEILQYYHAHLADYQHKSQARWEQLTVLYQNFPTREAAHQALQAMGREAYYGGSMQAVARAKSQEPLGKSGGVHDWTNQGSLASEKMDQQIFSLPVNEMSEIFADESGFHIVRVLERKPAGVTPLGNLQEEIRKQLQEQKIAASQRKMLDEMTKMVPVWSLFPEDVPEAKPLPRVATTNRATKLR